jgi:hypothetical protein
MKIDGVTTQNKNIDIFTIERTSNLTEKYFAVEVIILKILSSLRKVKPSRYTPWKHMGGEEV